MAAGHGAVTMMAMTAKVTVTALVCVTCVLGKRGSVNSTTDPAGQVPSPFPLDVKSLGQGVPAGKGKSRSG